MTSRQHLIIDTLGQSVIIIFYSLLIGKSNSPIEILKITPLVLLSWQIINALISYIFYNKQTKKLFVRISIWTLAGGFIYWGCTWLICQFSFLSIGGLIEKFESIFWILIPFFLVAFCFWYLYISLKEIYNIMFNTI